MSPRSIYHNYTTIIQTVSKQRTHRNPYLAWGCWHKYCLFNLLFLFTFNLFFFLSINTRCCCKRWKSIECIREETKSFRTKQKKGTFKQQLPTFFPYKHIYEHNARSLFNLQSIIYHMNWFLFIQIIHSGWCCTECEPIWMSLFCHFECPTTNVFMTLATNVPLSACFEIPTEKTIEKEEENDDEKGKENKQTFWSMIIGMKQNWKKKRQIKIKQICIQRWDKQENNKSLSIRSSFTRFTIICVFIRLAIITYCISSIFEQIKLIFVFVSD